MCLYVCACAFTIAYVCLPTQAWTIIYHVTSRSHYNVQMSSYRYRNFHFRERRSYDCLIYNIFGHILARRQHIEPVARVIWLVSGILCWNVTWSEIISLSQLWLFISARRIVTLDTPVLHAYRALTQSSLCFRLKAVYEFFVISTFLSLSIYINDYVSPLWSWLCFQNWRRNPWYFEH